MTSSNSSASESVMLAVHMIGQFASDLANDHPAQVPADKGHRTVLRGNVLHDCGEPVSVALRMATVDPETQPRASYPSLRKYPRNGAVARSPVRNPGTTITTSPSPRGAATSLRDRHARRAGFTQGADLTKTTRRQVGRPGVRQSKARSRLFLRLMLFGVGAPNAQGDGGAAALGGAWIDVLPAMNCGDSSCRPTVSIGVHAAIAVGWSVVEVRAERLCRIAALASRRALMRATDLREGGCLRPRRLCAATALRLDFGGPSTS